MWCKIVVNATLAYVCSTLYRRQYHLRRIFAHHGNARKCRICQQIWLLCKTGVQVCMWSAFVCVANMSPNLSI